MRAAIDVLQLENISSKRRVPNLPACMAEQGSNCYILFILKNKNKGWNSR
jgi:hypothetical protein